MKDESVQLPSAHRRLLLLAYVIKQAKMKEAEKSDAANKITPLIRPLSGNRRKTNEVDPESLAIFCSWRTTKMI